jgi:hypothetical protein
MLNTILLLVFVLSPNSLPSRQNSVTAGAPTGLQEQAVLIPPVMCAPLPAAICWKRWIETGLQRTSKISAQACMNSCSAG